MKHAFDDGYGGLAFRPLVEEYPGANVYPARDFRVEWGPVFHRGRLDGSARVLVIGQDPGQQEAIVRRILVGLAGHRTQGFLAKLGIDRSYVMVNTFLYSVASQRAGATHAADASIARYRERWFQAVLAGSAIQAVVALGGLADAAWQRFRGPTAGSGVAVAYAHVTHPTAPRTAADEASLVANWNAALARLRPSITPDRARPLVPYGPRLAPTDLAEIPEEDLPAGLPAWMRGPDVWARRTGPLTGGKRFAVTVTVPAGER